MVGNTGTYLDVPVPPVRRRWATSPTSTWHACRRAGRARRRRAEGPTGLDALAGLDVAGRAVLVRTGGTGTSARPSTRTPRHPYLGTDAAEALAAAGAAVVGIDSINIDGTRTGERPVHTALLGAGVPVIEHLTGLDRASRRVVHVHRGAAEGPRPRHLPGARLRRRGLIRRGRAGAAS